MSWNVEIRATDWFDVIHLSARDISRGGIFIRADEPLEAGQKLQVRITLPDGTGLDIGGEVMHSISSERARSDGLAAGFGLRFGDDAATDLSLLEAMAVSQAGGRDSYRFDEIFVTLPAALRADGVTAQHTSVHRFKPRSLDDLIAPDRPGALDPLTAQATATLTDDFVTIDVDPVIEGKADDDGEAPRPQPAGDAATGQPLVIQTKPEQAIFGIDFGTTYTSIALVDGDRFLLLDDEEGHSLTPSVVCYPEQGQPLVGWPAREKMLTHPATTFKSPKRILGRKYDDRRIDPFIGASPVRMKRGPNGQVIADIYGSPVAIPQVCAEIFRHAAVVGERATGLPVKRVLLSSPVGFEEVRPAIKRAAQLAGLEVLGIIDEPVAAAMAYGLGKDKDELVAIYDFGGGTFDFTLLQVRGGTCSVLGEAGDEWLGGDDFDLAIAEHAANVFARQYKVDLRNRMVEWQRLLFHCELAKRQLSSKTEVELLAKGLLLSIRGPIDLRLKIDRELFDGMCGELVDRSIEVVDSCLSLLDTTPTQVDQLVMTGGVSRIPLVRERVQTYFGRDADASVDPEHAIVLGNAIYGRFLSLQNG